MPVVRSGSSPDMPETLLYATQYSPLGGGAVTAELDRLLLESGQDLIDANSMPYSAGIRHTLLENIKETLAYASLDVAADRQSSKQSMLLEKPYTLPGGNVVLLRSERFSCAEVLFDGPDSLPDLIIAAIESCPEEYREELWGNVVLSGGNTKLRGFAGRLHSELQARGASSSLQFISNADARKLPWLGGSQYSSLEQTKER